MTRSITRNRLLARLVAASALLGGSCLTALGASNTAVIGQAAASVRTVWVGIVPQKRCSASASTYATSFHISPGDTIRFGAYFATSDESPLFNASYSFDIQVYEGDERLTAYSWVWAREALPYTGGRTYFLQAPAVQLSPGVHEITVTIKAKADSVFATTWRTYSVFVQ